jgi:tRNA threonylcarbamoyladenosine modification (KEOPS) complex Cgi121 subunit
MIFIGYIHCNKTVNPCEYLKHFCNCIKLCLYIEELPALWEELSLAFIKTLKAVEDRKTVARKIEFEFYIRFFAERQIHYIINKYLATKKTNSKTSFIITKCDKDEQCVSEYLKNLLNLGCKYIEKPGIDEALNLYSIILKHHDLDVDIHSIEEIRRIALGIIGCNNILIKK